VPLDISPARDEDLDALLPLIAGYQRFYGVKQPDDQRNRAFFSRFLAPSDDGLLLAARASESQEVIGFANLYWTFSSVSAEEHAVLNDLFVTEQARGTGAGRKLVDAAAQASRERGMRRMSWETAPDNTTAQRLYDSTGAAKATWLEYELTL
jgi:ribosomal protein S18 acetylase RimI-like enzyme